MECIDKLIEMGCTISIKPGETTKYLIDVDFNGRTYYFSGYDLDEIFKEILPSMMLGDETIIENSNGKRYEVLEADGEYLLLKNLSCNGGLDKYLVVYNLYPDRKGWQRGVDFETQEKAEEYFDDKK